MFGSKQIIAHCHIFLPQLVVSVMSIEYYGAINAATKLM